jgi:hypothetical protein
MGNCDLRSVSSPESPEAEDFAIPIYGFVAVCDEDGDVVEHVIVDRLG